MEGWVEGKGGLVVFSMGSRALQEEPCQKKALPNKEAGRK